MVWYINVCTITSTHHNQAIKQASNQLLSFVISQAVSQAIAKRRSLNIKIKK